MPVAKSLPVTVEAAFAMDMGRFIGAINEGFEGNTAEVVVALLEKNCIRSNRRLASTLVSCFIVASLQLSGSHDRWKSWKMRACQPSLGSRPSCERQLVS